MIATHRVRKGETLSSIARKYGTTIEKLVEANDIANPCSIEVGQVLIIPPRRPPPSGRGPDPRAPAPEGGELGALSRRYEAPGGPGTVSSGEGDAGGVSYGSYQFASKSRSVLRFVESLKDSHPRYYAVLAGKEPATEAFTRAWRAVALVDPLGFDKAQHDYIQHTHYEPALACIRELTGLDLSACSHALREVAWSTAVQHGPRPASTIFEAALGRLAPSQVGDEELIRGVYAERGRRNAQGVLVHFKSSSKAVQALVTKRFQQEQEDALALLARERAGRSVHEAA